MIEIRNLSKRFKLYDKPSDRILEIIFRRSFHRTHQALNNISLTVQSGETCGIIGQNGAGKSTMLKLLTGVLLPDSGEVKASGKITGLLELGAGFDYSLSGHQNITINSLLLGMNHKDISRNIEAIIEFSELGDFIHEPMKIYSSGMAMRLAFSIAIHAEPQCFVIDEALSVGDAHFQQKCMKRIRQFREAGGSIIFVSHDLNAVKMLCDKVLVLDNGEVVAEGTPEQAVNHYNRIIAQLDEDYSQESDRGQNYGTREVEIVDCSLRGEQSSESVLSSGEGAIILLTLKAVETVKNVTVGVMIRDRFGQDIFGTNSKHLGRQLDIEAGQALVVRFCISLEISPGKYTLTAALHSEENHLENCYHWHDNLLGFEVAGIKGSGFSGVCRLPATLDIHSC